MSQFNNIKITPNVGATGVNTNPKIEFTGAGNSTITLQVSSASRGGLLFYGANGDMLSIVDAPETFPSFSVNDRYSVPIIEAYPSGNVFLSSYPGYQVGVGTTGFSQSNYKFEVYGGLKVDDISSGSGKFNVNISRSIVASPTGVLNSVLTFPSTAGKRYIIHSISVANVGRRQPQGAGATVGINTLAGGVSSFTLTNPGAGYTAGDLSSLDGYSNAIRIGFATVSFVGVGTTGDPAYAGITSALGVGIVSLTRGAVTGIVTVNTGAGYTAGDVGITSVVFDNTGTGGTGVAATVAIDTVAGIVTNYTITNPGTGYTVAPLVTITSPIGIGTTAEAISQITLGIVTGTYVTYPGFAYTSIPTATFRSPNALGITTAVVGTGTAVLTLGEVVAAYLNVPGEGYTIPPNVSIASTTGIGAQITSDVDSDGKVIRLNLLNRGYGYSRLNQFGNSEENEVYISLPGLAKTEVGVDIMYRRAPVGTANTIDAYIAFDVPIPVGGVLEVLKQPSVLYPSDAIHIRGLDVYGSGLSNAVDIHIAYEEENTTAFVGVSTALGSTIGLGTNVSGTLISATTNPILLQSLRLTNTEFVGDYDTSVKIVSDRTIASLASTAASSATTFFVAGGINSTVVTTNSIVSIGTFIDKAPITGIGSTSFTISITSPFSIAAGTGVTFFVLGYDSVYFARNLMIPSYASVELFDMPKRLERYSSLVIETDVVGIDANIASTIDVDLSGKIIY